MRKAIWVRLVLAGAALATMGFAVACGGDDNDEGGDLEKVTLMLNWTPNTHHNGIYVAQQEGWYRDAGLDVTIIEPGQNVVEQAVASGNADIGISIQEAVIPARAEGIPVVSIGTIIQHNDSSLMSLTKDNIKRPKDLEGKKFGGFGGALEEPLIKQLVACDGGDPSKVEFVQVGNVDYVVGMEQDRFDVSWVFESWDVIRAREIEGAEVNSLKFIDYLKCIPDWYTPLFIATEETTKTRPEMLRKFMDATAKGYDYARTHPKDAGDALLAATKELDRPLVEKSSEYMATRFVDAGRPWGLQDEAIWVAFEKHLRDSGLTTKQVDVKGAYSNEFLPKK